MSTPISTETLEEDRASLDAVREMKDYSSLNPQYSLESLNSLAAALDRADATVESLQRALAAARTTRATVARDFHNGMVGARTNVSVRYGPDSHEVQAVGLKRKSDYKRPARRAAK